MTTGTMISLLGWMITGVSIALIYCHKIKRKDTNKTSAGQSHDLPNSDNAEGVEAWCGAVEVLTDGMALLFDRSFKLVTRGRPAKMSGSISNAGGTHIIDILPANAASEFIERSCAAKDDERIFFDLVLDGKKARATSARLSEDKILLIIKYFNRGKVPCLSSPSEVVGDLTVIPE